MPRPSDPLVHADSWEEDHSFAFGMTVPEFGPLNQRPGRHLKPFCGCSQRNLKLLREMRSVLANLDSQVWGNPHIRQSSPSSFFSNVSSRHNPWIFTLSA